MDKHTNKYVDALELAADYWGEGEVKETLKALVEIHSTAKEIVIHSTLDSNNIIPLEDISAGDVVCVVPSRPVTKDDIGKRVVVWNLYHDISNVTVGVLDMVDGMLFCKIVDNPCWFEFGLVLEDFEMSK